tara:strand:- start:85 stop:645 length:561 start_codon:yes stop_codon:yes gene_type:complete
MVKIVFQIIPSIELEERNKYIFDIVKNINDSRNKFKFEKKIDLDKTVEEELNLYKNFPIFKDYSYAINFYENPEDVFKEKNIDSMTFRELLNYDSKFTKKYLRGAAVFIIADINKINLEKTKKIIAFMKTENQRLGSDSKVDFSGDSEIYKNIISHIRSGSKKKKKKKKTKKIKKKKKTKKKTKTR